MCLVGAVGRGQIFQLIHDAPGLGFNPAVIDMEKEQYSKLISDILEPDIAISMGCNVGCPFIGRPFDDNWGLDDPTGKSDEDFIKVINQIELKIKNMIDRMK